MNIEMSALDINDDAQLKKEKYDIIREEKDRRVKVCCSDSNKEGIKFLVSISVLSFAMLRLMLNTGDSTYEASLISFILGVYFPSPLNTRS